MVFVTRNLLPCLPNAQPRVILAVATLHQLLVAGIVFGWANLVPILLDQRIFADKCSPADQATYLADPSKPCDAVLVNLNLAVTTGFSAVSFSSVLFGPMQDYISVFYSRILACTFSTAGIVFFAFLPSNPDLLNVAMLFVGAGGGGIQLTGFSVGQLFPATQGLATSLVAASFSVSSLVFLVLNKLYFSFAVPYQSLFLFYAAVPLFVLCSSFLWPHQFNAPTNSAVSKVSVHPADSSLHQSLLSPADAEAPEPLVGHSIGDKKLPVRCKGARNVELHQFGWKQQACSIEFLTLVAIICFQSLASNIFVSSYSLEAQKLTSDASLLSMDTTAFSILFPLCSITTPLIGYIMDRAMLHSVIAFVVTLGITWQALVFVPDIKFQIFTYFIPPPPPCHRPILHSCFTPLPATSCTAVRARPFSVSFLQLWAGECS
jgi:MFS family permease